MSSKRTRTALVVAVVSLVILAACDKKEEQAASPAPEASSSTPPASTPPASTPAASTHSAAVPPAASATGDVPAECDAYIEKVTACMDKLGTSNASASGFKQQLDSARAQWASVPDKTRLSAQCKQSADLFAQSATQMGCR